MNFDNRLDEEKNSKIEGYLDTIETAYLLRTEKLLSKLKNSKENIKENKEKYKEDIFWDKNTKTDKL
jgi:hypothetical protein